MSMRFSLEALGGLIEEDLRGLWIPEDALGECLEAHAYPTLAGGKRIRPLLVLLAAAAFGGEDALRRARPTACALECVHTYSLVHDDLPCMDDDALRRGRPTTHVVYGDAKALLVGDGLLTHAFFLVASRGRCAPWLESLSSRDEAADVAETLASAAGPYGMVGGQWLDITATGQPPATGSPKSDAFLAGPHPSDLHTPGFDVVEEIHRLKTGKLLGAALECGVVHGLASLRSQWPTERFEHHLEEAREKARLTGELTGLAFQIVDDILDATRSSDALGKTAGKDAKDGKLTSVSTLGLDGARARAAELTTRAQAALTDLLALAAHTTPQQNPMQNAQQAPQQSSVSVEAARHIALLLQSLLNRTA